MNLLHYIQGFRQGKNAHGVERKAMQDPFLAEALEGFDMVPDDHAARIAQIQQQILRQTKKRKQPRYLWYSAAASLLLLIGVGTYFGARDNYSSKTAAVLAELKMAEPKELDEKDTTAAIATQQEQIAMTVKSEAKKFTPTAAVAVSETAVSEEAAAPNAVAKQVDAFDASEDGEVIVDHEAAADYTAVGFFAAADSQKSTLTAENESKELEEVVVVGYGTAKRSVQTGSVASMSDKVNMRIRGNSKTAMPQPVIGNDKFYSYIKDNMVQPTDSCARAKGVVILVFTVNSETGKPENVKVKSGLCSSCDKEAIRLLKSGPEWTRENGEGVAVVQF